MPEVKNSNYDDILLQAQVSVEAECEVDNIQEEDDRTTDEKLNANYSELLDKAAFLDKIKSGSFEGIEPAVSVIAEASLLWDIWTGKNKNDISTQPKYLSKNLCAFFLNNKDKFNYGIDFNHLPAGFFWRRSQNDELVPDVLDFDKYYADVQFINDKISKLAVSWHSDNISSIEQSSISADEIIGSFDKINSDWWNLLYNEHIESVPSDRNAKKSLLVSFLHFKSRLEKLELSLPKINLQDSFKDIKSMPVALGRIVSILENCRVEDRLEQMELIPNIDLSSQGLINIVNLSRLSSSLEKCNFIHDGLLKDYIFTKLCAEKKLDIREIDSEQKLFIYLSYQNKRRDISFYKEAIKILDLTINKDNDLEEEQKKVFYSLLAESTTGSEFLNISNSEALENWEIICEKICNAKLPFMLQVGAQAAGIQNPNQGFKCSFINDLKQARTPNVIVLTKVIDHQLYWISKLGLTNMNKINDKMHDFLQNLDLLKIKQIDYTSGFKFYVNENLNANDIDDSILYNYFSYQADLSLDDTTKVICPYFSTFNLMNGMKQLEEDNLCNNISKIGALDFALSYFKDVESNENLDYSQLKKIIAFIESYKGPQEEIIKFLQENFSENFREGYFKEKLNEFLNKKAISKNHQLQVANFQGLTEKQRNIILSILEDCSSINFEESRSKVLSSLDSIMNNVSESEFNDYLKNLDIIVKTYKLKNQDFVGIENSVLNILTHSTKLKYFYFFDQLFSHEELEKEYAKKDLLQKFSFYLENLAPFLDKADIFNNLTKSSMQNILSTVLLRSGSLDIKVYKELSGKLDKISSLNNNSSHLVRSFFTNLNKDEELDIDYFESAVNTVLESLSILPENSSLIHSLLFNFQNNPKEFLAILEVFNNNDANLSEESKILGFEVISALIDNKQFDFDDKEALKEFKDNLKNHGNLENIKQVYNKPPYPSLKVLNDWFMNVNNLEEQYKEFNLNPFGSREFDKYGFTLESYLKQKAKFEKSEKHQEFIQLFDESTDLYFKSFFKKQKELHKLDTSEILSRLDKVKEKNNPKLLLPYVVEMLARTTSQKHPSEKGRVISQELNATQIMAIYAMLTSDNKKIVSEILTGQGKSRITMVMSACLALQGKTVDFITSNMQLSERDYISYKAFFKSLGIDTSLIFSNTNKRHYKEGGVNFSDPAQISLARNKAIAQGNPKAFGQDSSDKHAQILDEFDVLAFDLSHIKYNFSEFAYELESFSWIYEKLNEFIVENYQLSEDAFKNENGDITALRDLLNKHVINSTGDLNKLANFQKLYKENTQQIDIWLKSAWVAHHMKEGRHFLVDDTATPVMTTKGIRYSKQIKVLSEKRVAPLSTYAKGVHQCLCARMNVEYKSKNTEILKDPFVILPEKRITFTSGPSDLLEMTNEIYAVTGTKGDSNELIELYNKHKMVSVSVPPAQEIKRRDHRVLLTKDKSSQYDALLKLIKDAQYSNRSVLVICEDDEKSQDLSKFLEDKKVDKMQRVHAGSSYDEESNAVSKAGEAKTVTISTPMMGRGTDINADNLLVVKMFLPNAREAKQGDGRSGRFGKQGDAMTIINKEEYEIPVTYNHDHELRLLQIDSSLKTQKERFLAGVYAKIKITYEKHFFSEIYPNLPYENRDLDLRKYQENIKHLDELWLYLSSKLKPLIDAGDSNEFINKVSEFIKSNLPELGDKLKISEQDISWVFDGSLTKLKDSNSKIKLQPGYEAANNGQASAYSSLFADTFAILTGQREIFANTRAWLEGTGVLFADERATFNGDRPIFANTRQFIYDAYIYIVQLVQKLVEYFFPKDDKTAEFYQDIDNVDDFDNIDAASLSI